MPRSAKYCSVGSRVPGSWPGVEVTVHQVSHTR